MPIHRKNHISYFTFKALDNLGIKHGVFMRHGGCSEPPWSSLNLATSVGDTRDTVIENRRRITDALGRDRDSIYDVWQIHSNRVIYSDIPRKLSEEHEKADAIITDNSAVTLLMLFADCVPIFLYEKQMNISAIAHAGWKGTVNKVIAETVKTMVEEFNCQTKNITACIGPSICADHYVVGLDVVNKVNTAFSVSGNILFERDGQYNLDLQEANKQTLLNIDVHDIHVSGICTACNSNDWFSHRAESGITGRFAAVIACK